MVWPVAEAPPKSGSRSDALHRRLGSLVPTYGLHDTTGDDLGLIEHPAPNIEPRDLPCRLTARFGGRDSAARAFRRFYPLSSPDRARYCACVNKSASSRSRHRGERKLIRRRGRSEGRGEALGHGRSSGGFAYRSRHDHYPTRRAFQHAEHGVGSGPPR